MNKPVVFSDRHHASLYNSLHLLFEGRLKGTLFNPIGREWVDQGYWKMAMIYNNSPVTIEQYLGIKDLKPDNDGIYHPWDSEYNYAQNAITLEKFFQMPIDIVIASLPEHIKSFGELCAKHPNKPKLIYQVGNAWSIQEGSTKNILASAIIPNVPPDTNMCVYHQEFDLENFYFQEPQPNRKMYSFINCFATAEHYSVDWFNFLELEAMMPDWEFRSFGGSCRDGAMNGTVALANKMREANFIHHTKRFGDGMGHLWHNAFAIGRPVITRFEDYKDKLGGLLFEDGVTGIDIGNLSMEEAKEKIGHYCSPIRYEYLCQEAYRRFKEVVDFDKEEIEIRKFLDKLR